LAEQAAKAANRSLNAELVSRIEVSFLAETHIDNLIPAARAKELALMARASIPDEIRKRAIAAISRAIRLGHNETTVSLNDLNLEIGIPDADIDKLTESVIKELETAGYRVRLDDINSLWLGF
jgi:hypothetical protein